MNLLVQNMKECFKNKEWLKFIMIVYQQMTDVNFLNKKSIESTQNFTKIF